MYYYKVWFTDLDNASLNSDYKTGKFTTSPNENEITKINFVIAGGFRWSNFGHIKIEKEKDGKYHFIYNVIDSNNRIRPNSTINLIPK
jgi:hypothetical protein